MTIKKDKILYAAIGIIILCLVFFVFVPAFAGRLQINPVIELASIQIRWYGVILAVAILSSYLVARKNAWKFGIAVKDLDDYAFWGVLVGILGARIYYVAFSYEYFLQNPGEIYKIWHGGLSVYGSVLAGLIFTGFYVRNKAYTFWQLFDLVAIAFPLGQAIGRLGNFVNQEAFGIPTNLLWKMYVDPAFRPPMYSTAQFFHPTFLYEALFDLLVFYILYRLLGKTKTGIIGLSYLALYSLGRFFIEPLRLDSFIFGGFRVDQVVAFLILVVSGSMIFVRLRKY